MSCGQSRRIVLACFGSLGDVHPYIAIALGLRERGATPVIAAPAVYREKIEGEGIAFHAIRPELPPFSESGEMIRRAMDGARGTEYVVRHMMVPHVRAQYEDLLAAARDADMLVTHPITFAGPLAARKLGLPWAASFLQPILLGSWRDPPVPPHSPDLEWMTRLPRPLVRAGFAMMRRLTRPWARDVERFAAELSLPPAGHPIFEGQVSPYLNLALFSPQIAPHLSGRPPKTVVTGFPFYDREQPGAGLSPELDAFLKRGTPPIVFTLGSSAVALGGDFYVEGARAAAALERRAVLLVGRDCENRVPKRPGRDVFIASYAPHGELFPRAAAIVHQGGIGTMGQALRSGRPMLVVPFAHDQPDNACRARRLGVARVLPRARFRGSAPTRELRVLLESPAYAAAAADVGARVRAEDGVGAACSAILDLLA